MASSQMEERRKNRPPAVDDLFSSAENNDPAKCARRLLDTISITGHIATALHELTERYGSLLPRVAVDELEALTKAATFVHGHGFRQVTKVSVVKNLIPAYNTLEYTEVEAFTNS